MSWTKRAVKMTEHTAESAENRRLADLFAYIVPDGPKMLRETLCVAQSRIGNSPYDEGRKREHIARLQRLIDECDRMRPLGPNGKHDDRHTPECGCEDNPLGGPSGRDRRVTTPSEMHKED